MNPRVNARNTYIYLDNDGSLKRIKKKGEVKMQRYTMEQLLRMSSEDLEILQNNAWLEFKRYDNALAAVKIMERETDKGEKNE